MPLSLEAAGLVLLAALFHASWNALVKTGGDRLAVLTMVNGFGMLICFVLIPFVTIPDPAIDNNAWPFGFISTPAGDARYQQAYDSVSFGDKPMTIRQISFFRTLAGFIRSGTYTISLSTITEDIDSLSITNYDANLGSDNKLFVSTSLAGQAPEVLTFDGEPFHYDPSMGNLLLDVRVEGFGGLDGFSAHYAATKSGLGIVSRYTNMSATGPTTWYGWGLATRFSEVPEPSTVFLLFLGIIAVNRTNCPRFVH